MTATTSAAIDEIRVRANAASSATDDGGWLAELASSEWSTSAVYSGKRNDTTSHDIACNIWSPADAVFIANARQDVPALLDHIDSLRRAVLAEVVAELEQSGQLQAAAFVGRMTEQQQ